jgi:2-amino-4-hydroxy-6-hydroxymethyldihydropteridine diphosphokinase
LQRSTPIISYIALGANLGDREMNIKRALQLLHETPGIKVTKISSFLENPAVGGPADAPSFINAAAEIETTLGSHALLQRMMEIEITLGRQRRTKWEPRPIDLDILLYGDQVISSQELIIPHPLMHERRFVLQPLAEIGPDVVHPMLQMSIAGLLDDLTSKGTVGE